MKFLKVFLLRLWLFAVGFQHLETWKAFAQETPCEDKLPDCSDYLEADECERYSGLTRQYCAKSCNYCPTPPPTMHPVCKDLLPDCAVYIGSPSQCHAAKEFFTKYCPRTCGYCVCGDILPECASFITNPDQCRSSRFFSKYCQMSCNRCGDLSTLSPAESSSTLSPTPNSSSTESSSTPESSSTESSPAPKSSSIKDTTTPKSSSTKVTTTPKSSSIKSPPTPVAPLTASISTQQTTKPVPIGPTGNCADVNPKQCASMVTNDPDACRNDKEYMEKNCPETCKVCGVDPYCEDKMPKECMNLITRDKEYCKTRPEFMKKNCARTCEYCGCSDLLAICSALVENNKDYCDSNRLFMKTNCPKSCDFCNDPSGIKPPASEVVVSDCVDKRKRCKLFASNRNYCSYQKRFMMRNCAKACQFCEKEYNFAINTEWNGAPINHAPITFEISAQDSRAVRISASGPFFDDPGPPPCAAGSACDGLWDYEVAEVFFLGKNEKYLEIELSPHGQHLLLLLNGVRKPFLDKMPINYTAKIDRANNTWTGTAKIPIDYFPPDVEKINAYAIHGSGVNRRYESLYPASASVSNPDFHRLEFFKPFDFKAMFTPSWGKPKSPLWKNSIRRIMRARARM